ncbi:MAG: uroporphyrinogen-III synthase [Sulfitobacter sp.]
MPNAALIITRPAAAAARFLALLDPVALTGIEVIRAPLLDLIPLGQGGDIPAHHGAIFTARAGVELAPPGRGRPAFCVGDGTAELAASAGWVVRYVAPNAQGLIAAMQAQTPLCPLTHFSGSHVRGDIAGQLNFSGWQVTRNVIYDQRLLPLPPQAIHSIQCEIPTILPVFSPRSANQLALEINSARQCTFIALSPAIASQLRDISADQVIVLDAPRIELMQAEVEKQCQGLRLT